MSIKSAVRLQILAALALLVVLAAASLGAAPAALADRRSACPDAWCQGSGEAVAQVTPLAASIGDFVWRDVNLDGFQQATEQGIQGVQMELLDAAGITVLGTQTTNPSGAYVFAGLAAGTYQVRPAASNFGPGGVLQSFGLTSQGTFGSPPHIVTLADDEANALADFGYALADMQVVKSADDTEVSPGATVIFTYEVTNTGDTYLGDLTITDDQFTLPAGCFSAVAVAPGETFTCQASQVINAAVCNIANASADSEDSKGTVLGGFSLLTEQSNQVCITVVTGGSIGDYVWNDQDGDRIQDPAELGIPGVTVVLTDGIGNVLTTTTDGNGNYLFTGLPAGSYTVTLDEASVPPEYVLVTTPYPITVNLSQNQIYLDADIGLKRLAIAVGDFVWYDTDKDGRQDVGEPGLGNISMQLWLDDDGNGQFNPTFDFKVDDTVTDSAGAYRLDAPAPGDYFVVITDDYGMLSTYVPMPGPQSLLSPSPAINLEDGEIYRDADFGYVRVPGPGNALIGDQVWIDVNQNGTRESNEPIIINVLVCATPLAGGAPLCETTDINGRYLIEVPAGTWVVAPTAPPFGLTPTTPVPQTVTVAAGDQYLDADFGYYGGAELLSAVGGQIWQDLPDVNEAFNGLFEPPAEPGIPDVSVNVIYDNDGDGVRDPGEPILASGSEFPGGDYLFEGLLPGAYLVEVSDTLRVLRYFEVTVLGPNQGQDNNNQAQPYAVGLSAGETDTTADFGYREFEAFGTGDPTGIIGDQLWLDVNGDGLFNLDDSDLPLAGITLELAPALGLPHSTTTGGYGKYLFVDLALGEQYSVRVTDQFGILSGYLVSRLGPNQGSDNNNQAQPYNVFLGLDPVDLTADFAYVQPVTVGDFAWLDSDNDGMFDPGEQPLDGVTIQVRDASNNLMGTVTTGSGFPSGQYLLGDLLPGAYTATAVAWPSTSLPTSSTSLSTAFLYSGASDLTLDFPFISTTHIPFASFDAWPQGGRSVHLRWTTIGEEDGATFHVLRAGSAAGEFRQVTLKPILGLGAGGVGHAYTWIDDTVRPGATYWYKVVVLPDGQEIGPVAVQMAAPRLFLPLLLRDR
jgi:uncharacterized repeat protein (TIGR01451 family)